VDERTGGAAFRTRLDFCRSCHGSEEIVALSGHRTSSGEAGCGLCHGTRTDPELAGALKKGLNRACAFCHPPAVGRSAHYAEYNPFSELKPEAQQAADVELLQGRYTCATCHRHHRPTDGTPFFKPGFVVAVSKSFLVNPHQSTRFCLNCHPGTPPAPGTDGAEAPLVDADVTRLCQRCHEQPGALQMHHPLGAPSAEAVVPAGWPLRADGRLGCQTCHLAGHGPADSANPQFLRGGPYRQRNEVCLLCHVDASVPARNIHAEIAEGAGCDFCHERAVPTLDPVQAKVGPTRAEPSLLCLRCHAAPPHPASAVHTVRPRPSSFLKIDEKAAPLALGKVTCNTCHDSHALVASNRFLRVNGEQPICTSCHPF
jgi:predicted CXXCH cytochrome family protein